jgi:hypothetical protein
VLKTRTAGQTHKKSAFNLQGALSFWVPIQKLGLFQSLDFVFTEIIARQIFKVLGPFLALFAGIEHFGIAVG